MPAEGHARRKLFEAHESTKSPIAEEALQRIQALYQIEADITGHPAADRRTQRQARAKPLLDDLKTWMDAQRRRASSKTPQRKALRYALGRWEALTRYADDGRLAIDNNFAERLLRGIAVTRKNFLFLGSDAGGDRAAILYTLIETAKLNGLNPEAYLAYGIDQLARGHLVSRLGELLPCWGGRPTASNVPIWGRTTNPMKGPPSGIQTHIDRHVQACFYDPRGRWPGAPGIATRDQAHSARTVFC